jgi:hypothetical protein
MKRPPAPRQLSFQSRLERIAPEAEYFAVSVPMKISPALGTRGPVPVSARVNDSEAFPVSLFPVGGGRLYLRVKAKIRAAAKIKEGDRVRVRWKLRTGGGSGGWSGAAPNARTAGSGRDTQRSEPFSLAAKPRMGSAFLGANQFEPNAVTAKDRISLMVDLD